ncbi:MAG: hypothetical protein R6V12_15180 [Candidatus Hydrogenedentota bacterium]
MGNADVGNLVLSVIAVIGIAAILALPIISAVWAYGDAERRGKSGCLVAILVLFLSWPLGFILWLVFRPEDQRYPRY